MQLTVLVTTVHPILMEAIIDGFERVYGPGNFILKGVPVDSAVARQPIGFDAIYQGAKVGTAPSAGRACFA